MQKLYEKFRRAITPAGYCDLIMFSTTSVHGTSEWVARQWWRSVPLEQSSSFENKRGDLTFEKLLQKIDTEYIDKVCVLQWLRILIGYVPSLLERHRFSHYQLMVTMKLSRPNSNSTFIACRRGWIDIWANGPFEVVYAISWNTIPTFGMASAIAGDRAYIWDRSQPNIRGSLGWITQLRPIEERS